MGLFKRISTWFDRTQAHFSYRQRFLLFAFIYFLILPYAMYVALHTANFMIRSQQVQQIGVAYQRGLGALYDALLRYQVASAPSAALKKSLDGEVRDALEALRDIEERNPNLFPKKYGMGFSLPWLTELNVVGWQKQWNRVLNESIGLEPLIASIKRAVERSGEDLLLFNNDDPIVEALATPLVRDLPRIELSTAKLASPHTKEHTHEETLHVAAEAQLQEQNMSAFARSVSQAIHEYEIQFPENSHQVSRLQKALTDVLTQVESANKMMAEDLLWNQENFRMTLLGVIDEILAERIHTMRWAKRALIVLVSISSILILLFIFLRALSSHFRELAYHIQDLAKGAVTSTHAPQCFCSNEKDEFGQVGRQLDQIARSTAQSVTEIQEFGHKIQEVQTHIALVSHDEVETIRKQEESLSALEVTIQNISSKARQLADMVEGMDQQSPQSSAGTQVDEGLKRLQTNMGTLVDEASQIVNLMKSVEEKVAGMNSLITFIHKVSERANLLSLNAAIETAVVTKQQESFASIAQKIQRFAQHTSGSTQEIRAIFQEMSSNVAGVKIEAVTCFHEIHTGAEQLVPVNSQLKRITQRGMEQRQKYEQFGGSLQTQATHAEGMIQPVAQLKTLALDNQQLTQALQTSLEEIETATRELKRLLKKWDKRP